MNDKLDIFRKYGKSIELSGFEFFIKPDIPQKRIEGAIKKYASGVRKDEVLALYDDTIANNGKSGCLFTADKVCWKAALEKPHKMWYSDIVKTEFVNNGKKDCDNIIVFTTNDGGVFRWDSTLMNKTPVYKLFNELIKSEQCKHAQYFDSVGKPKSNKKITGSESSGIFFGNKGTVNRIYDEEKFHASRGHGYAAERANNLVDRLKGRNARIVGDDNVKNGPDRIVNGTLIQSKYCATGKGCIKECFEDNGRGSFRYFFKGKPMQIEVPSDKYEEAVAAMKDRIRAGQVNGVTNPEEAKNIVKKGHFTYAQARNIAKAGTVDSIAYDAATGSVTASCALGVSAVLTFASMIWNGEDADAAIKAAAYSGIKVGGTTFIVSVVAGQLSKAGLNSMMVESSEAFTKLIGPKASATLINAFRSGNNIYGAAAMKSAAKLIRGNAITGTVTVAVLSIGDIVNIFRSRISGKQFAKNFINTASSVGAGTAGAVIGSAIPVLGTVAGGIIGAFVGGVAGGKLSNKVTTAIFGEDDAEKMVNIIQKQFEKMASDYLLTRKEAEKSVDSLREKLSGKILKDMFASQNKEKFAEELLKPIIEKEIKTRQKIYLPDNKQINKTIREILENAG